MVTSSSISICRRRARISSIRHDTAFAGRYARALARAAELLPRLLLHRHAVEELLRPLEAVALVEGRFVLAGEEADMGLLRGVLIEPCHGVVKQRRADALALV